MAPRNARRAGRRRLHAGGHVPPDARHRQGAEHPVRARLRPARVRRVARCDRPGEGRPRAAAHRLRRRSTGSRRRSSTSATPSCTPRSSSSRDRPRRSSRGRPIGRTVDRSSTADGRVSDTFPRQYARTQRFTLGEPRNLTGQRRRQTGRVPAQRGRQRPGHLAVGARRRHRRGADRRRRRAAVRRCRRRTTTP